MTTIIHPLRRLRCALKLTYTAEESNTGLVDR